MLINTSSLWRRAKVLRQRKPQGLALTLALFSAALAGRFALDGLLSDGFPFLTFFPAILLATLFAGRMSGALCTLLSILAAWYWFIEPRNSFGLTFEGVIALMFFSAIAIVDVLVIDLLAEALDKVEALQLRTDALVVQRTTLFHEQQHRVANNLATVATALILQEQRLKHNSEAVAAFQSVRRRFEALARIHRGLQDPVNGDLPIRAYLQELCNDFLKASGESIRCEVECADVAFDADRTVTLSLIVLEAVTNAAKHAFTPGQLGVISVRLEKANASASEYVLTIEDNGCGISPDFDAGQSTRLGAGILGGFARSLMGQLSILPASQTGGTVVKVLFPHANVSATV